MDTLTSEKRSWNMSRIRGANTKPELAVRSMLHRMGYRFRIANKTLQEGLILFSPNIGQ